MKRNNETCACDMSVNMRHVTCSPLHEAVTRTGRNKNHCMKLIPERKGINHCMKLFPKQEGVKNIT